MSNNKLLPQNMLTKNPQFLSFVVLAERIPQKKKILSTNVMGPCEGLATTIQLIPSWWDFIPPLTKDLNNQQNMIQVGRQDTMQGMQRFPLAATTPRPKWPREQWASGQAERIPATQHASDFWFSIHIHPFAVSPHLREPRTTHLFGRASHSQTLRFSWNKLRLSCVTGLIF